MSGNKQGLQASSYKPDNSLPEDSMSSGQHEIPSPASTKSGTIRKICSWSRQLFLDLRNSRVCSSKDGHAVTLSQDRQSCMNLRFLFILCCIFAMALTVVVRLVKIQIIDHANNTKEADKILGFRQVLLGLRGNFYDATGNILAGNIHTKDLYLCPGLINHDKKKLAKLYENRDFFEEFCAFVAQEADLPLNQIRMKCLAKINQDVEVVASKAVQADLAIKIGSMHLKGVEVVGYKEGQRSCPNPTTIIFHPKQLEGNEEQLIGNVLTLEYYLNIPENELLKQVYKALDHKDEIRIKQNISLDEASMIEADFYAWRTLYYPSKTVPGKPNTRLKKRHFGKVPPGALHIDEASRRYYTHTEIMNNLIGRCDEDSKGYRGLEKLLDPILAKQKNGEKILKGNGRSIHQEGKIFDEKLNGTDVYLTIHLPLQQIVEDALWKLVEEHKPKKVYIIMASPQSGAILALAQYLWDDDQKLISPEFHAPSEAYEPGSIMKGVSVACAMDKAGFDADKIVFCENGQWSYKGCRALKEHGRASFSDLTVREIIQKSSNIGSSKLVVENLDKHEFYNYLSNFGFGKATEIGFYPPDSSPITFKQETKGKLNPNMGVTDMTRIAIGHAIQVNPFQMVQAYIALANGGTLYQLQLVDHIVDANGKTSYATPIVKGHPVSYEVTQKMRECLMATVEPGGTGKSAAIPGYHVAGKTGTAMKAVNGRYTSRLNTASFIGFAPAEAPRFVLLITVDEPSGPKQYGGSVCGSAFAEIGEKTLRYLRVPPTVATDQLSTDK